MNNKGITLITVVVIIIVIIIIATTSIIAGNKLVVKSRELTDSQILESIKEAVNRKKAELSMQGSVTPKGDSLPGKQNPTIGDGAIVADGWYLLYEDDLLELGVKDIASRVLVNYDYDVVLNLADSSYLEQYFVVVYMHKIFENVRDGKIPDYIGLKLEDKASGDSTRSMYVDYTNLNPDYYGTGWYVVNQDDIIRYIEEDYTDLTLTNYIKNDYLVNYEDSKYKLITVKFEEI